MQKETPVHQLDGCMEGQNNTMREKGELVEGGCTHCSCHRCSNLNHLGGRIMVTSHTQVSYTVHEES